MNTSNETPKARKKKTASALKFALVLIFSIFIAGYLATVFERTSGLLIRTPKATLSALVADTEVLREKGLSGRDSLCSNQAMLFVFDSDSMPGFWMKDMKFQIDIIWLDSNKRVVTIKSNADPAKYPEVYYPELDSRYVVEISSGLIKRLGIGVGTVLSW